MTKRLPLYSLLLIAWTAILLIPGGALAASPPSLEDGFVGNSSSDDCFPFDLGSHVAGSAIDLLPEANYPYDATIKPDGSEVWFVGASGDGVVVIDRATNAVVQRFDVSEYPISVAFSSDGSLAVIPSRDFEVLDLVVQTLDRAIDPQDREAIPRRYETVVA